MTVAPCAGALLVGLAAAGCAGTALVSAPTGPPELLVRGHGAWRPLDRAGYEQEIRRLGSRNDLVPLREWPEGLPADAPVFVLSLAGPLITLAIRGDVSSGFGLLADLDGNGELDPSEIPFRRSDDAWIATFQVPAPAQEARLVPVWIELRWQALPQAGSSAREWTLLVGHTNVRRGVVELAGRKRAFAVTGEAGRYGRHSNELFLDLDGDGRLSLDSPYGDERFLVEEKRVVVGHTAYGFAVDVAGEALTLTRLPGRFRSRPSLEVGSRASDFVLDDLEGHRRRLDEFRGKVVLLDFWALGCAPCIWELPELARLRAKHRDRGFEIVGIHVGPRVPEIATTCAAKGAEWPQLVDTDNAVAALYRVDRYPTTFLLDQKGRILHQGLRGPALAEAVEAALAR